MQRSTKYSLFALLVLVGLTAFLIYVTMSTPKVPTRPGSSSLNAQSHMLLRAIHQGMAVYAASNDGRYPPVDRTFDILIEQGLIEPELLVSPLEDGDGVSYILVGLPEATYRNDLIVAYEDPKHRSDGVTVVFDDNHTEVLPHAEFEAKLAEQTQQAGPP